MNQPVNNFNLEEYILHHVQNSHTWHVPFLPPLTLPNFISVHALMILLASGFLLFVFGRLYRKDQTVPTGMTNALEIIVLLIRDKIAIENLGEEEGRKFTPFFCTLFFFILILNVMGLIPIFSTATANFTVTTALALVIFCFMTFGAIKKNGLKAYCRSFLVSGVPLPMQFLLLPLEILGIFTRTFALTIRLLANMLAGHMVMLAFFGLVALFGWVMAPPAVVLAIFISLLEVLVAFLQAYIFTLLSAIFIGQMYHPKH